MRDPRKVLPVRTARDRMLHSDPLPAKMRSMPRSSMMPATTCTQASRLSASTLFLHDHACQRQQVETKDLKSTSQSEGNFGTLPVLASACASCMITIASQLHYRSGAWHLGHWFRSHLEQQLFAIRFVIQRVKLPIGQVAPVTSFTSSRTCTHLQIRRLTVADPTWSYL